MNLEKSEHPRLARLLGYAGLVPFALLAALLWTAHAEWQALVAAALVLCLKMRKDLLAAA